MLKLRTSSLVPSSPNYAYIYLVGLIAINEILIGWLLFLPLSIQFAHLIVVVAIAVGVVATLRHQRFEYFFKPLMVIFAGGFGILLGCILDFGQYGLINLSSLCLTPNNDSSLKIMTRMVSSAPWSHTGMWVGCSVALLMVDDQRARSSFRHCGGLKHLFCLVGMLPGMWSAQLLPSTWISFIVDYPVVGPTGFMWLAMSIGMLVSYFIFDATVSKLQLVFFTRPGLKFEMHEKKLFAIKRP